MRRLDPIERLPDGTLFRLTPGQLRSVRGLTKRCCNFLDSDCLLLDRASIFRQNGYVEPDGTIRLYFTLEQAQTKLHRSRQCATRIFHELEFSGLICRKKQGLGKPALITLNYPSNAKLIQPKKGSSILSG